MCDPNQSGRLHLLAVHYQGRGNYRKISHVAIVVLDRETSNQVRMWLGNKILTPRSEKKNVLNILIGRYIVHFLVTGK